MMMEKTHGKLTLNSTAFFHKGMECQRVLTKKFVTFHNILNLFLVVFFLPLKRTTAA